MITQQRRIFPAQGPFSTRKSRQRRSRRPRVRGGPHVPGQRVLIADKEYVRVNRGGTLHRIHILKLSDGKMYRCALRAGRVFVLGPFNKETQEQDRKAREEHDAQQLQRIENVKKILKQYRSVPWWKRLLFRLGLYRKRVKHGHQH